MKVATPLVVQPKMDTRDSAIGQEQPHQPMTADDRRGSSFGQQVVEKTVDIAEKAVDMADPRNIFAPNDIPERLVLSEGLFSGRAEAYPILQARTKFPFHNLSIEAKDPESGTLVVEDSSTGMPVVVIERTGENSDVMYMIYKTSPSSHNQESIKTHGISDLYPLATVQRTSLKDLQVTMDGQTEPSYHLEKAGIPANYATKYFIKQVGEKEEVASTHPWQGDELMLVVKEGMDATLMLCFAIIADDADVKSVRRESFSEMMGKVNPAKMFRSKSSGSKYDKSSSSLSEKSSTSDDKANEADE